jgi:Polysaccharide biosynthesis protein
MGRAAIASVASDQQISSSGFNGTVTLNEALERDAKYSSQRLFSILFGVFSAMALALALVGIFSLVAYSVAQSALRNSASAWRWARRARMCCGLPRVSRWSARPRAWSSVLPLTAFSAPSSPTGCKAALPRVVSSQPPRSSLSAHSSPACCQHATPSASHPLKLSGMNKAYPI